MSAEIRSEQGEEILREALQILEEAKKQGVTLRIIGGIAFRIRCPSSQRPNLKRNYQDIDLVGLKHERGKIRKLLDSLHYEPRVMINSLFDDRMIFEVKSAKKRIDIFLDVLQMCHKLNFKERIGLDELTLPLADLLLTKLQAYEFTEREYKDVLSVLLDYPLVNEDGIDGINSEYIEEICRNDWGFWRTLTLNLDRVSQRASSYLDENEQRIVLERIGSLKNKVNEGPKSLRWKLRGMIGERVKWYETPEEIG